MIIAQETVRALSKINNGFGLVGGTSAQKKKALFVNHVLVKS